MLVKEMYMVAVAASSSQLPSSAENVCHICLVYTCTYSNEHKHERSLESMMIAPSIK